MGKVVYVLPYESYFARRNNRTGGHIAHMIGFLESLIGKGHAVEIVSDMEIPDFAVPGANYFAPRFTRLRKVVSRLETRCGFGLEERREIDGRSAWSALWRRVSRSVLGRPLAAVRLILFWTGLWWTTWRRAQQPLVAVVYVRHNLDAFAVALAARVARKPLSLEVNTPASMGPLHSIDIARGGSRPEAVSWRERVQYASAAVISVVSPPIREWIAHIDCGRYAEKIIVNPNGVNPLRFTSAGAGRGVRSRLEIDESEMVIGMAASFVWYNAIEELMDAYRIAAELEPACPMRLLLIGDSELRPTLENHARAKGLEGSVLFAGRVAYDEMPAFLEACDILVSHFNFRHVRPHICAVKHLEYMAIGRAIVASAAGYANFAIHDRVNGLVVGQGDTEGFGRALAELAADAELRQRLGREARNSVTQLHTWDANVDRVLMRIMANER